MLKTKKGYLQHPFVIALVIGFLGALILVFLLNKGMIPGVNFKFC
jgi:cell division protein FtsX